MHPLIYDVAVSMDGFICGPNADVSQFPHSGPIVEDYARRLDTYDRVLMGRHTYEFGYAHGLVAGQNPYPKMQAHVFSSTLQLPKDADVEVEQVLNAARLQSLKRSANGPLYLCGGGFFAAAVLATGELDMLRLKRAPVLLGDGVPLFGRAEVPRLRHRQTIDYGGGLLFQEFDVLT